MLLRPSLRYSPPLAQLQPVKALLLESEAGDIAFPDFTSDPSRRSQNYRTESGPTVSRMLPRVLALAYGGQRSTQLSPSKPPLQRSIVQ